MRIANHKENAKKQIGVKVHIIHGGDALYNLLGCALTKDLLPNGDIIAIYEDRNSWMSISAKEDIRNAFRALGWTTEFNIIERGFRLADVIDGWVDRYCTMMEEMDEQRERERASKKKSKNVADYSGYGFGYNEMD